MRSRLVKTAATLPRSEGAPVSFSTTEASASASSALFSGVSGARSAHAACSWRSSASCARLRHEDVLHALSGQDLPPTGAQPMVEELDGQFMQAGISSCVPHEQLAHDGGGVGVDLNTCFLRLRPSDVAVSARRASRQAARLELPAHPLPDLHGQIVGVVLRHEGLAPVQTHGVEQQQIR